MTVELKLPPGATITVFDKDGKPVVATAAFGRIEVTPFFATASGAADVLEGKSKSKARGVVDSFVITASGNNGKVGRRDQATLDNPAEPAVDKPLSGAAAKAAKTPAQTE